MAKMKFHNGSVWETLDAKQADFNTIITATGTATVIALAVPTLLSYTSGFMVTFIASANNSGSATTININGLGAKNFYKPGTTTAPTLISGKAYTAWYNGTSFFIKASAEGTAVAANVLAGTTFSNDNDTGIAGSMPNRGAIDYTPTASNQNIADGRHASSRVLGVTNLTAGNVRQGATVGGTAGSYSYAVASKVPVAGDIISGKSAFINGGAEIAGSMVNRGTVNITPSASNQTIAAGRHSGSGVVYGVTVPAANVLTGTTIAGTAGTMPNRTGHVTGQSSSVSGTTLRFRPQAGYYPADVANSVQLADANFVAGNIKSGVSIFGLAGSFNKSYGAGDTIDERDMLQTVVRASNIFLATSSTIPNRTAPTVFDIDSAASVVFSGTYHSGDGTVYVIRHTATVSHTINCGTTWGVSAHNYVRDVFHNDANSEVTVFFQRNSTVTGGLPIKVLRGSDLAVLRAYAFPTANIFTDFMRVQNTRDGVYYTMDSSTTVLYSFNSLNGTFTNLGTISTLLTNTYTNVRMSIAMISGTMFLFLSNLRVPHNNIHVVKINIDTWVKSWEITLTYVNLQQSGNRTPIYNPTYDLVYLGFSNDPNGLSQFTTYITRLYNSTGAVKGTSSYVSNSYTSNITYIAFFDALYIGYHSVIGTGGSSMVTCVHRCPGEIPPTSANENGSWTYSTLVVYSQGKFIVSPTNNRIIGGIGQSSFDIKSLAAFNKFTINN